MNALFRAGEIHPKRWAHARQRAAVLQQYMALAAPTVRDADEAAARLGIKRRAFYYLIDRSSRTPRPPNSAQRTPTTTTNFSGKTILKRQRMARSGALALLDERSRIAVDHAALEMAIATPQGKCPAYLTIVLDRSNGSILGYGLGLTPPGPQSAATALCDWSRTCAQENKPQARFINLHLGQGQQWTLLSKAVCEGGLRRVGRSMSRLPMGSFLFERMDKLGSIPLRPRLSSEKLKARINMLPAVDFSDAQAIVAEAIEAWNAARPHVELPVPPRGLRLALLELFGGANDEASASLQSIPRIGGSAHGAQAVESPL